MITIMSTLKKNFNGIQRHEQVHRHQACYPSRFYSSLLSNMLMPSRAMHLASMRVLRNWVSLIKETSSSLDWVSGYRKRKKSITTNSQFCPSNVRSGILESDGRMASVLSLVKECNVSRTILECSEWIFSMLKCISCKH